MGYIIDHVFDNPYTSSRLEIGKDENVQRLKRERSKNRLTFRLNDGGIGEVFILSGDSRNKLKAGEAVMGFGAPNVVLDEAALLDDVIESKIFRMLGDSMDNFYLKIGNPFKRNHFYKSSKDEKYYKMNIDYKAGLKENRLTQDFIDEARLKPNFSILYENKFPESDMIDEKGWSQLLMDSELENALTIIDDKAWVGVPMIGVDVARGGGCENVWALRTENYAEIIGVNKDNDLMSVAATTIRLAREWNVNQYNVFIDDNGVGGGVTDRLRQMQFYAKGIKNQEKPDDETMFVNRRAENAWRLKKWIAQGGKLCKNNKWDELLDVKYKAQDSSGKIILMSKQDMATEGLSSPDRFDALCLTFTSTPYRNEEVRKENFDPYAII